MEFLFRRFISLFFVKTHQMSRSFPSSLICYLRIQCNQASEAVDPLPLHQITWHVKKKRVERQIKELRLCLI
jgi:hypothetical protein